MTRNVLVTGGLGYIGGRVARHLADNGWRVTLTSRRALSPPAWAAGMDLGVARFPLDDAAGRLCEGMDAIVHLAAPNEIQCQADPGQALADTAIGTWQLLEAAKSCNVRRFLYFSTIHVYGEPLEGRIDESRLPRPMHPYAIANRAAEDYVLAAARRGSVTGAVLRLSNAVGAPAHPDIDRWTLLVNDLCRQAARKQPLILRSSGIQYRNFVAMNDVTRAVAHLLEVPAETLGDGLLNLGGRSAHTILAMTELVARRCEQILGYRPPVQHPPTAANEVSHPVDFRSDRLYATGFKASGDLEAEVDDTLRFCAAWPATP